MKISHNWLKQFINFDLDHEKTADILTNLGLEVEGIEKFSSFEGSLAGLKVGQIVECEKHPNADRLKLTSVDIGEKKPLNIICGAPNVSKGIKVAVATVGTELSPLGGKPFKIKKNKIRGIESYGMLCSEMEIGIGINSDGILIFDKKTKIGTNISDHISIENDVVYDIGLTPNRADATSHFGVARDIRAALIEKNMQCELRSPSVSNFHVENRTLKVDLQIEDPDKVPRYCGITISGINVNSSPVWLQNKLNSIGITPINNIVDITNYVCHSIGQPLHAFDYDKISGKRIVVRNARENEKIKTLDSLERSLNPEDILICDDEKPMCIAGIYGGEKSGVDKSTKNIFLESAYFDPVETRKSAKLHSISTDASFRFERGIDINNCKYALKYAAILIRDIACGTISCDIIDEYPKKINDKLVFLNFENLNKLIGHEIPKEKVKKILSSIDIKINNITEVGIGLSVPPYRVDVYREVDVIEEILRIFGYNNIPRKEKFNSSILNSKKLDSNKIENYIANQLMGLGFNEIITNSLTSHKFKDYLPSESFSDIIEIKNPQSKDLSFLRKTTLFSGLHTIRYNLNHKNIDLKLFEFGKTYSKKLKKICENKYLSIFITGNRSSIHWRTKKISTDFFFIKGIIDLIFGKISREKLTYKLTKNIFFDEGQCVLHNNEILAEFGTVQKNILHQFNIEQKIFYAKLDFEIICDLMQNEKTKFKKISKFPIVKRDFSLLLDENITFETIKKTVSDLNIKILKEINLFDVYKDKNLTKDKKSYAISFSLESKNRTLTEREIQKVMDKLKQTFEEKIGAKLR